LGRSRIFARITALIATSSAAATMRSGSLRRTRPRQFLWRLALAKKWNARNIEQSQTESALAG
jgi:hypothetical protein